MSLWQEELNSFNYPEVAPPSQTTLVASGVDHKARTITFTSSHTSKGAPLSTKPRTLDEINSDYAHKLAQLGEHQYRIEASKAAIAELTKRIDVLQAEARRAQQSMKSKGLEVSLPSAEEAPPVAEEVSSEVLAG